MRRSTLIFMGRWLLCASLLSAACTSTADSSQNITEISFSNGGSRETYWYKFTLRSDNTAQYLGDVSPERRGETRDEKIKTEAVNRLSYRGQVSAEQFRNLGELIIKNDFRSMAEELPTLSGAPMTTTGVVYADKLKEVSDQQEGKGTKLTEINQAIARAADQIKWEQETK